MKKIAKAKMDDLFKAISEKEVLYLPVDDAQGQAAFIPGVVKIGYLIAKLSRVA